MKKFLVICLLLLPASGFAEDLPVSSFASLTDHIREVDTPELRARKELGRRLYFDASLSRSRDISCNSCHNIDTYGVDNLPTSPGHKGQHGDRNSPTTFNAALHVAQFWDGRAKDLKEQALGPMLNPVEMALASEDEILERVKENPAYEGMFRAAFPEKEEPLSIDSVAEAIAFYEETLLTPSRFDEFLDGDTDALTVEEKAGLKKFVETGCTVCHSGVTLGGHMYQKLGLVKPYETEDTGRFKVTGADTDKFFFKVPSLRNIEKTAPYFHDGSVETLEEAVVLMARHQLGRELPPEDVQSIITFLKSLTGTLPESE